MYFGQIYLAKNHKCEKTKQNKKKQKKKTEGVKKKQ